MRCDGEREISLEGEMIARLIRTYVGKEELHISNTDLMNSIPPFNGIGVDQSPNAYLWRRTEFILDKLFGVV